MSAETLSPPTILIRGRSVMALVVAPEWPLEDWLEALDEQMGRTASLFGHRPVVVHLGAAPEGGRGPEYALDALLARNLRVIGVDGLDPARLAGTRWARLPIIPQGRETILQSDPAAAAKPPPPPPSLLVERPVRSGQAIVFEQGDVTIIGPVASGAEVIAGGSIHVYGALRGRAIAGVMTGGEARIFCRRMEAELVAVDGLYRMAEHWGQDLHGHAVQIRRDQGTLALSALD
ncbi:MAG TPA: septum site-determining protein MinC [Caulobacteraceae bacterium]|nr:septum site-determining protein MinC [Caulobacteraceae bacterium]